MPDAGQWRLPVANRATTTGVGQLVATVVTDVATPAADAASKGLFGVDLKVVAWTAGLVTTAALAGPPIIRAATK
jgi:hypothetical protein